MNKEYWKKIFTNWYHLPKGSKLLYYKNPNECYMFNYERVNPDHIGLIWGKRKTKGKNWVKICKVSLGSIALLFQDFRNQLNNMVAYVVNNPDVFVCFYMICFALVFFSVILRVDLLGSLVSIHKGG
jgi:hypothetical protein